MCVVMIADKDRLTDEMIEKGADANKDGNGIAWREKGEVRWEKGLSLEDMKEYSREAPLPYIAHFRIASCGGKSPALCHPFPIEPLVSIEQSGSIPGFVLFHNGHWGAWKHELMTDLKSRQLRIPKGSWSDTRGIAWMAAMYGLEILELIDEKCAVLGPESGDLDVYGTGWSRVGEAGGGILVSNKLWDWSTTNTGRGNIRTMCLLATCARARYANTMYCFEHQVHIDETSLADYAGSSGGGSTIDPFRGSAKAASRGEVVKQETEASPEGVRGTAASGEKEVPARHGNRSSDALVRVNGHEASERAELKRWACSINVKGIDPEKQKRIQAAKNGNRIVGPL